LHNGIKTAIIGVGNAACTFLQGLEFYSRTGTRDGIWHTTVGGYSVKDIEVVAAYDIDERKVGQDLSDAAFESPNSPTRFVDLKSSGIEVASGILVEDLPSQIRSAVRIKKSNFEGFVHSLRASGTEIAVLLTTSGIPSTGKKYADACISAGVSLVNATPNEIASLREYEQRFFKTELVAAGDDLIRQFGGTVFHKGILDFMDKRGVKIEKSYQLDVGGGLETLNTIDEEVRVRKREMKTQAIAIELPYQFKTTAGTTDYVDYMGNNRTSYFWILGKTFLGADVKFDIYLRTNDGANAGNVLLDVIRAVKSSKESKKFGVPTSISCYGFKKTLGKLTLEKAEAAFQREFMLNFGSEKKGRRQVGKEV
jgi:myo-inositol-1-phosphate synthase